MLEWSVEEHTSKVLQYWTMSSFTSFGRTSSAVLCTIAPAAHLSYSVPSAQRRVSEPSLMMKGLLHPLILLLMISSLASCRLVQDFLDPTNKGCPQFFVMDRPNIRHATPTILQGQHYQRICQEYKNKDWFATLYDTQNKIPVYSAFLYINDSAHQAKWRTEPELGVDKQANDQDYAGNSKISLYPALNEAAFTLTNAAPQGNFKLHVLQSFYQQIAQAIKNRCEVYQAYIVTGVVPSTRKINGKVAIPDHFWSAYCCKKKANDSPRGAYITPDSGEQLPIALSVRDLGAQLAKLYKVEKFQVFGDLC
ncbi:hypothetical protein MHYP_G00142370 [Metynnis hypsauchen]